MQNFSLSKSYELAQLFSSLFPLFLYVAMVCRFVSRHKNFKKCFVFTNPFLSLCTSGSARMHSASLSVADFWMGSWFWYWIINFLLSPSSSDPFFFFLASEMPDSWSWMFSFGSEQLYIVTNQFCLFESGPKPFLFVFWAHRQFHGQGLPCSGLRNRLHRSSRLASGFQPCVGSYLIMYRAMNHTHKSTFTC